MAIPLLKQSDGRPSVSFSMMVIGFIVITLWLIASIFEELWGLKIRAFDPASAMSFFTPLLTLYFSRRWTDAKNPITPLVASTEPNDSPSTP
jgi:hypothetical protein